MPVQDAEQGRRVVEGLGHVDEEAIEIAESGKRNHRQHPVGHRSSSVADAGRNRRDAVRSFMATGVVTDAPDSMPASSLPAELHR